MSPTSFFFNTLCLIFYLLMEFKVYKCVFCHLFLLFFPLSGEISEESKAATIEMLTALQSRKDALQESLKKKTDELKALCLKEAVIIHFIIC